VQGYTLVAGTTVTIAFTADRISAVAGCNTLASSWSLDGNVLVVAQSVSTMMACNPPELQDQDIWLNALLTSKPTVSLGGDTLTIVADGATVTLVDQAATSPALEGPTWTVEGLISGSSVSSVPAGANATLTFQAGTVAVDTGCNTGSGSYAVAGDAITFGPIAMTRRACVGASETVEPAVLAVLDGTATMKIAGDELTLMNGTNGLQLRASSPTTTTTTTAAAAGSTTTTGG
jgi:heat shock protein HslJ